MTVAGPMSPSLVAASRRSVSELPWSQAILTAASAERWAGSGVSAWMARADRSRMRASSGPSPAARSSQTREPAPPGTAARAPEELSVCGSERPLES